MTEGRGEEACGKCHQVEGDQVFRIETEPGDGSWNQPPALIPRLFQPDQGPTDSQPGERLENIGQEQCTLQKKDGPQQDRQSRQPLSEPTSTENTRELRCER